MLREQRRLAIARLPEIVRVLLVHTDARIDRSVDGDHPALLLLADDHIGNDGARLECADLGARSRIEAANQVEGRVQILITAAQRLEQPAVVARGHERESILDDLKCQGAPGRIAIQRLKLQGQALPEIPCGDTTRLQGLHDAQGRLQLTELRIGSEGRDLFQGLAQESILIERVDDQVRQLIVALREAEEQQLLPERVTERGGRRGPLGPVRGVIAAA